MGHDQVDRLYNFQPGLHDLRNHGRGHDECLIVGHQMRADIQNLFRDAMDLSLALKRNAGNGTTLYRFHWVAITNCFFY